jgi:hypothetical protein
VLLKNALGFALVTTSVPAATTGTWIACGVLTIGALALAAWVFLRLQGVETWEATRAKRWTVAAGILALLVAPMLLADTNYDATAPHANRAPALRGIGGRTPSALALVPSGAPAPSRCCSAVLNRETDVLPTDAETREDLLIFLPIETSQRVRDLHVTLAGDGGLMLTSAAAAGTDASLHLEIRNYPNDSGPLLADGQHLSSGWVARVPVTIDPAAPWDIGGDRYPLTATVSYRAGDEGQPRTFTARAAIDAQVASGIYEMGAASSLLPLVCFGAAIVRRRRTR